MLWKKIRICVEEERRNKLMIAPCCEKVGWTLVKSNYSLAASEYRPFHVLRGEYLSFLSLIERIINNNAWIYKIKKKKKIYNLSWNNFTQILRCTVLEILLYRNITIKRNENILRNVIYSNSNISARSFGSLSCSLCAEFIIVTSTKLLFRK